MHKPSFPIFRGSLQERPLPLKPGASINNGSSLAVRSAGLHIPQDTQLRRPKGVLRDDVRHLGVGVLVGQKLLGLPESLPYGALRIVEITEYERLRRTPFNAGRLSPLVHPVRTKSTLRCLARQLDAIRRCIRLVRHGIAGKVVLFGIQSRNTVGTGIYASLEPTHFF